jgi:replicative DNA helicase
MSEQAKELFCQPVYERVLLAYCFKSINNYYNMSFLISESDFLRPEHRFLYMIFNSLSSREVKKFDSSMVINEAKKNGIMENIGGYEYLNAIMSLEVENENLSYYINKILDISTKYRLYTNLQSNLETIEMEAKNDEVTSVDLIGKTESDVMNLSMESNAVKEATNLSDGIDEYIEERKSNPIKYCGISTGFSILDSRIDGLIPGALHVVCARPKHGKSTFLSTVAAYAAYTLHKSVLYVDTEMPFDQWRSRMLSMLSGVPERRVKHGGYTNQEYDNIKGAAQVIKKGKLFHEYMPGYNIGKLTAIYKKYKHIDDIELAIFDYIKTPSGSDFRNKKEYQLLGDVTTALKDLSGQLKIPFFAANQINRQQDIADSDRILRYSDIIMFLKPKDNEEIEKYGIDYGTYRLIITDSRRGGTTPQEGIDYQFIKTSLQIFESPQQRIDYESEEYKEKDEGMYDSGLENEKINSTSENNDEDEF